MPAPLLVADAPSLLYRAFFALPDSITDDKGRPVNALLGASNLLLREVADRGPRAVVICFGAEAAAYRVDLYSGYHAQRPPMPPELGRQWELAPKLWRSFGWAVSESEELEADDLLGAYARAEAAAGGRALVLTGDRDLYQVASESVTVLYVRTGKSGPDEVGPAEVARRYGVAPELVADFIALRGDPSDGLPGAPGIGEKTAADLLRRHGSLGAAITAAEGERPRVAAALTEHADALRDYLEIATLRAVDVELPESGGLDGGSGAAAAEELGMRRLAERLRAGSESSARG